MALNLKLYTRTGCHLCEEMEQALVKLENQLAFTTEIIEINNNQDFEKRYGDKVPILMHGNNVICTYVIDEAALSKTLKLNP